MGIVNKPSNLYQLRKRIPVLEPYEKINTGYILEYMESGEAELKRYKNGIELENECIYVGYMLYDDFNTFIKEIKEYVGRTKVYLSHDYATVLLAVLNGKMPEDYE